MPTKAQNEVYITPEVAIGFPTLFEAKLPGEDATVPMYSAALVFLPGTDPKVRRKLEAMIEEVGRAYHGKDYDDLKRRGKLNTPIRDEAEDVESKGYPKGSYFMNAKTKSKPGVVGPYAGKDGKAVEITNPDEIFPGCMVRASINFFGYAKKGNSGVGCGLRNVQKIRDGNLRFDSRKSAKDEFAPIEADNVLEDDDNPFK